VAVEHDRPVISDRLQFQFKVFMDTNRVKADAVGVQATYDKLKSEVPKYKMITTSILSDRLKVCFHGKYKFNVCTH